MAGLYINDVINTINVYTVKTDPKKYTIYNNAKSNSPTYGILPINANMTAPRLKNAAISNIETQLNIIGYR